MLLSLKSVTEFQSVVMIAFRFKSIITIKNSKSNVPAVKRKISDLSLVLIRFPLFNKNLHKIITHLLCRRFLHEIERYIHTYRK